MESNYYQRKKAQLRQKAIDFQSWFGRTRLSYLDIAMYQTEFRIEARKYGLLKEFKENGIC